MPIFRKLRYSADLETLKKYAIVSYAILAWGDTGATCMNDLERVLKILYHKPQWYSRAALYRECGVRAVR